MTRKRLVEPIKYSKQWLINNWISKMNDKKQDNNFYPEGLRYETVQRLLELLYLRFALPLHKLLGV